jgi:hypothetical protein
MKLNYKRSLKLITLLISSLLIATVSATVYYSLTMTSTVSVGTNDVYFLLGADNSTAGVTLGADNTTATLTSLKAYPNVTTTYNDPMRVRNNATSGSTNIRFRPVSLTGGATQFLFVNFTLVNSADNSTKASLNYTSNGSVWTMPSTTNWVSITAGAEWYVTIETKAKTGATTESVAIDIAVDVQ